MKNLKVIAFACAFLAVFFALISVDTLAAKQTATTQTNKLKIKVETLDGTPIANAQVKINETEQSFWTDNRGFSPSIEIETRENVYDKTQTSWFCVTVLVSKDGFVSCALFGCVVFCESTRTVTIRLYDDDNSGLGCVTLVESPPQDFVSNLFEKQSSTGAEE